MHGMMNPVEGARNRIRRESRSIWQATDLANAIAACSARRDGEGI
jgi:hypothetical protein